MSRDPRDRPARGDEQRIAEARALLERAEAADRGADGSDGADSIPDEVIARRVEAALAGDPALSRELFEDPELDRLLRSERIAPPSEFEWARVDAAIGAATGVPLGRIAAASSRSRTAAGRERSRFLRSRVLVPLAAAAILGAIVVREAFVGGLAPGAEATIVEVDLPDDRSYLILAGEEESDGVMIFITSS